MIISEENCFNFPVNYCLVQEKLIPILDYHLNALKPHIQKIKIIKRLNKENSENYLPIATSYSPSTLTLDPNNMYGGDMYFREKVKF